MRDPHVYQPKTPKKRFHPSRKQVLWAVTAASVLLLIVVGYLVVSTKMRHDDASTKIHQAIDQANKQIEQGDYKAARAKLKTVENLDASSKDKAQIYGMLASIAMAQDQAGDVIVYFEKKHDADPGSAKKDALDLATFYQRMGDNQKAKEQYEIAIKYLESQPSTLQRNMDLGAAKARFEELQAGQQ